MFAEPIRTLEARFVVRAGEWAGENEAGRDGFLLGLHLNLFCLVKGLNYFISVKLLILGTNVSQRPCLHMVVSPLV